MQQPKHPEAVYVRSAYLLARYDLSRTTLWRRVRAGDMPAPRYLPGGQRRWLLADVLAWETKHLAPAAGESKP
jgi:predicted DNA-binding transcriptional regulator AlpA